jgi:hypothetical protein
MTGVYYGGFGGSDVPQDRKLFRSGLAQIRNNDGLIRRNEA